MRVKDGKATDKHALRLPDAARLVQQGVAALPPSDRHRLAIDLNMRDDVLLEELLRSLECLAKRAA